MNARIAFILIAFASLSALAGCASTTPTAAAAAAPTPVVAFAVPGGRASEAPGPSRFETTAYQMRVLSTGTRSPFASRH